ncbi:MAG: hypothetical protein OXC60_20580 [Litoreibacter sp.]|nr:hypothetical protein [Litoreibacter sp.]
MDHDTIETAAFLESLMKKYRSDKADVGHLYHVLYDQAFQDIRHNVKRVMEIGLALFKPTFPK